MEIVTDQASHHIPQEWVARWTVLKDYQEEYGNRMEWDYTSSSELKKWIKLNQHMDEGRQKLDAWNKTKYTVSHELYNKFVPASSVMRALVFMNAVDGEYLLSVRIDEALPHHLRKQLYKELGQYVRRHRLPFLYTATYTETYGSYNRLNLFCDVALHDINYMTKNKEVVTEVEEIALLFPYDILIGILHTAQQMEVKPLTMEIVEVDVDVSSHTDHLYEPPWWLVRWDDILSMYLTEETMNERNKALTVLDKRVEELNEEGEPDNGVYDYLYYTSDRTQGDVDQVSDIVRIFLGLPLLRPLIHHVGPRSEQDNEDDGLVQTLYYKKRETFTSQPQFLWNSSAFLSAIVKQVELVDTEQLFGLAVYVFGIDRLLIKRRDAGGRVHIDKYRSRDVLAPPVKGVTAVQTVDASCVAAAWMEYELDLQYKQPRDGIPTSDYPTLMSHLLSVTNRDFIRGIAELCVRLEEEIGSKYWTDEDVYALGEAALNALNE